MYREAVSSFYLIRLSLESCMITNKILRICDSFVVHHLAGATGDIHGFLIDCQKVEPFLFFEFELEPKVIIAALTEVNPAPHAVHCCIVYLSIVFFC